MQPGIVEEQIHELLFCVHLQPVFASHVSESGTKLYQELGNVAYQRILQFLFPVALACFQKIETIWVFKDLLRQVAHRLWQRGAEVSHCLSLTLIEVGVDEIEQHGAAPPVLYGLAHEEECFLRG